VNLTDSHCHLNAAEFSDDCDAVLERACLAGVRNFVVVGCDLATSIQAVKLAVHNENIHASIGFHPDAALDWNSESKSQLYSLARSHPDKVIAWGEAGLDFLRTDFPEEIQRRVFDEQIQAAIELDLPLIVHCRDLYGDILDLLERRGVSHGVLHCFTGSAEEALRAVNQGLIIGVGGIATFKKSETLRQTLKQVPIEKIILETDCPYLSPEGKRGRRNEPSFLSITAQILAPTFGLSVDDFAQVTTDNAKRLFKIP